MERTLNHMRGAPLVRVIYVCLLFVLRPRQPLRRETCAFLFTTFASAAWTFYTLGSEYYVGYALPFDT